MLCAADDPGGDFKSHRKCASGGAAGARVWAGASGREGSLDGVPAGAGARRRHPCLQAGSHGGLWPTVRTVFSVLAYVMILSSLLILQYRV